MTVVEVMLSGVFNLLTQERIDPKDITGISVIRGKAIMLEYTHHANCIGSTTSFCKEELNGN